MIGSRAQQLAAAQAAILRHADQHPEAHGGLLVERGSDGRTVVVLEAHPRDLPWIEQRRAAA